MPTMPMTANQAGSFAWLYATGFMAHPLDEGKREEYLYWVLAQLYVAAEEEQIMFSRDGLTALVSAAARGVGNDLSDATKHGLMAGEVLLYVLQLQAGDIADAGLDKAQHMVSQYFGSTVSFTGESYRAGRETVANAWKNFRSVAHLWAAQSLLQRAGPNNDPDMAVAHVVDQHDQMLGIAAALLDMSAQCFLPRSGLALLSREDAWSMDGVAPIPVAVPPLSSLEVEWLGAFKPRFR